MAIGTPSRAVGTAWAPQPQHVWTHASQLPTLRGWMLDGGEERVECCQCHTALQGGAGRQTEASGCQNYSATVDICVSSGLWMPTDRMEAELLEHGQGRSNLGVYSGNFWELFVPVPANHSYTDFQPCSRL